MAKNELATAEYEVLPGVNWVNGRKAPANRKVRLTEAEARFDLDHGRIAPASSRAKAKPAADKSDDG